MSKVVLLNSLEIDILITRLAYELIENHDEFEDTVLLGLQPRGVFLAERVKEKLISLGVRRVLLGYLDITFFRDDVRRKGVELMPNQTKVDFVIEGLNVVLIDDVLYTGRSVRSALDAMLAFGRPKKVELLVLIDRKYSRDLPIEANYLGKSVNTVQSQRVLVQWKDQNAEQDIIWLLGE